MKLILPTIKPLDYEFGGMAGASDKIIFPDGNLIPFLPEYETQANTYFDDLGCVSHSFENAVEAFIFANINSFSADNQKWLKENIYKNGRPNFSDRDLIVLSGTTTEGNSGNKVLETAQIDGLISQLAGDFDSSSRDTKLTREYYYAYARTPEAQKLADEWNKRFKIIGEWVVIANWEEASKRGALQVYVNAWYEKDGVYYNPTGRYNHAVLMADFKGVKIFDTYQPAIKQLTSWDDAYAWALKINIEEKTMTKPNIANNTLVQNVTKDSPNSGQFGIFLDNKILVGDAGEVLATFYMRNNGDTKGKTKPLEFEQWNMFDKYNLKMEKI